jgi:hypothetical protein
MSAIHARPGPSMPDAVDGEPVLLRAHLNARWDTYRCCSCLSTSASFIGVFPLAPLCAIPYWLCGGSCRRAEAASFQLAITGTAIHFEQKLYSCCNVCCHTTVKKTIPLDKVIDVVLVADWWGDHCGCAERQGAPWQLHIQTAADGAGGGAELSLFCVDDPDGLRAAILSTKTRLLAAGLARGGAGVPHAALGAGKDDAGSAHANPLAPPAHGAGATGAGDMRAVLAVLERIEAAIHTGLASSHRAGADK